MSLEKPRKSEVDEDSYLEPITMGEALEAATLSIGDKPMEASDAVAEQAAEMKATSRCDRPLGSLCATAQSAATFNTHAKRDEDKINIFDVLSAASVRFHHDKAVTDEDDEEVTRAERSTSLEESTPPGGVAATRAEAARIKSA